MTMITGARYQIAVDGQPRSNRDSKAIAFEGAEYLKYKKDTRNSSSEDTLGSITEQLYKQEKELKSEQEKLNNFQTIRAACGNERCVALQLIMQFQPTAAVHESSHNPEVALCTRFDQRRPRRGRNTQPGASCLCRRR